MKPGFRSVAIRSELYDLVVKEYRKHATKYLMQGISNPTGLLLKMVCEDELQSKKK